MGADSPCRLRRNARLVRTDGTDSTAALAPELEYPPRSVAIRYAERALRSVTSLGPSRFSRAVTVAAGRPGGLRELFQDVERSLLGPDLQQDTTLHQIHKIQPQRLGADIRAESAVLAIGYPAAFLEIRQCYGLSLIHGP